MNIIFIAFLLHIYLSINVMLWSYQKTTYLMYMVIFVCVMRKDITYNVWLLPYYININPLMTV